MSVVGTIQTDVHLDSSTDGLDAAADAFLKLDKGEPEAPPPSTEEAPDTTPEAPVESEENTEEGEPESEPNADDPDEQEVEVKVGEETKKPKLKDLKRLYGQEAALTQKSQQASATLKQAQEREAHASLAIKTLLDKAEARFKQYADLDDMVLSQRMDTESFAAFRKDKADAEAEVTYLRDELGRQVQQTNQRQAQAHQEAAQACIKTLEDPKTGIKGWNKQMFDELSAWGDTQGLNPRAATNPVAWKILHMAHQYAKQQAASKTAEEKVTKARLTPSNTLRPKNQSKVPSNAKQAAMKQLRNSGSLDDAAAAFMVS